MAEWTGEESQELRKLIVVAVAFLVSLMLCLSVIGGWVAVVLYWIVPITLDAGVGAAFIRGTLALGGAIMIGVAYVLVLYASVAN